METYYTIEEKYLKAIQKYQYSNAAKSLQILNEIVQIEPLYARAHYQLGMINYFDIDDYQTAGYHFRLCTELEPSFPDVYVPYLSLLVFLNKENLAQTVAGKALQVPGVVKADIYDLLAMHAEKNGNWQAAVSLYRKALLNTINTKAMERMEEHIKRVEQKISITKSYNYNVTA